MHRKILALCAALVALGALAIAPAGASASTLKDTVNGTVTKVEAGKKIVGIGTTESIFRNAFVEVKCNENMLTGTVTNSGTDAGGVVEATIEKAEFKGTQTETKCASNLGAASIDVAGLPWCLRGGGAADTGTLFPNDACGNTTGNFTFTITAGGTSCKYTRANQTITGTVTTPGASKSSVMTVTNEPEFTFVEGGFLCGSANGKIVQMEFGLYTDTEAGNFAKDEEDPVWLATS